VLALFGFAKTAISVELPATLAGSGNFALLIGVKGD
jgi:hypothetical protein